METYTAAEDLRALVHRYDDPKASSVLVHRQHKKPKKDDTTPSISPEDAPSSTFAQAPETIDMETTPLQSDPS